jgi:hypothetical protein
VELVYTPRGAGAACGLDHGEDCRARGLARLLCRPRNENLDREWLQGAGCRSVQRARALSPH